MQRVVWSDKEIRTLRRLHNKTKINDLIPILNKTKSQLNSKIIELGIQKKKGPWTDKQLEYLDDNYGRLPAEQIAKRLHRSRNALKITAFRKLHKLNQRSNIYTSRAVAEELGLSCAKIVIAWLDRGYLKGERAPFSYGPNQVWHFEYEDIIKCLEQRPWLCRRERMPEGYFRSVVQKEWEKNPWYTSKEAAIFLGLADHNPIHRYIYNQWLPAVRRPMGGSQGEWIIRHKDLVEFQLHDPRPAHRKGVSLPETLAHKLERIEEMAWRALSRGHFTQFGHYAGVWIHLSSIDGKKPAPFGDVVEVAKGKVK